MIHYIPYKTMRQIFSIVFVLFSVMMSAQGLQKRGASLDDLIPTGWTHDETTGDLNKDGIPDLVIIATPDFKENIIVREDGCQRNHNQPVFAIYFGTADHEFALWRQYDEIIPKNDSEFMTYEWNLEITTRGTLRIDLSSYSSMGSYQSPSSTYVYRYQDGDFFLIGKDSQCLSRNTGELVEISENYLTHKQQSIKSNAFDDTIKPVEKWKSIPKKPLERLGTELYPD